MYPTLFNTLLFPLYDRVRGKGLLGHLREYQQNLQMSEEELRELQWEKLQSLLQHAYTTTDFYRDHWAKSGVASWRDIGSMQDFSNLPSVTKADVKDHYSKLRSSVVMATIRKSTGGSTGEPFRFELDSESNVRREAVMWRGYGWLGAGLGQRSQFLWGADLGEQSVISRLKTHLYHRFYNRSMLNSFNLRRDNMREFIRAIARREPTALVSYVNPLFELSRYALDNDISLWSPKVVLTGAEPLYAAQREVIQAAFKAPVHNTYGCREFMLIACECKEECALHISADHLVVETKQSVHGPGELLITDLHNYGMPLIRYENGDTATLSDKPCTCGNPLPVMHSIGGRQLDAIRTSSGAVIPGELFPHMLKEFPLIERFQVRQRSIEKLVIDYVASEELPSEVCHQILAEVDRYANGELSIALQRVPEITPNASGKHRVTISEL